MKQVGKYNLFKGISLVITAGIPLATAASVSDLFVTSTSTSISTAGVIAILIMVLTMKDKLLEQVKSPSALKIAVVLLILVIVLESILVPMKYVLVASCIALGLDTLILKKLYMYQYNQLPETKLNYSHFGFIFCKTDTLTGEGK